MRNGKSGANGPNVQLLVGRVPKSGPEHAVNLPLEAVSSVVEIQQSPGIVAQLNAQVKLKMGCMTYRVFFYKNITLYMPDDQEIS